jgi:DNA-binding transcriptional LysR family regulator
MAFDGRLLAGVGVLAAAVEGGSFVRAADALGLSASGVSRAIARLEARLGIRLFDRTTRSLKLTDAGARFYREVGPLLEGIDDAAGTASGSAAVVRGRLRINVDPFFARLMLAPRLAELSQRYPELELELLTRDGIGDLVAEGVDLALRFGPPPGVSPVARLLLKTRILTVASPGYLKRHGTPKAPADLASHACIQFRDPLTGRPFPWEFHRKRKIIKVDVRGPFVLTDVGTMLEACVAGAGVAQVMEFGAMDYLYRGRLVELFPDWPDETFPLYVFHPSRHHVPAKVRAFIDFCSEMIK